MAPYVLVQIADREACDRCPTQFFDVFRKFDGRLLSADEAPTVVDLRRSEALGP